MLVKELMPPTPPEGIIFVNGEFLPDSQAKISTLDHGLMYGDGCFDAWCGRNGFIYQLDAHLDRLYRSVEGLKIRNLAHAQGGDARADRRDGPPQRRRRTSTSRSSSRAASARTRSSTRASAATPASSSTPARSSTRSPRRSSAAGIRIKVLALRKLSHEGLEPQIKSLNYLNNVMGKLEAWDAGYDEGMFLDERGYACECPGFNILGHQGQDALHARRAASSWASPAARSWRWPATPA